MLANALFFFGVGLAVSSAVSFHDALYLMRRGHWIGLLGPVAVFIGLAFAFVGAYLADFWR